MAPEILSGENYNPYSIDVWALGVMLDEILFEGEHFYSEKN
jgi:serine/threonine protein kinase